MTAPFFNLVFSRSVDGDHTALQRWYSDHISILWRCESLRRATLYRRDAGVAHNVVNGGEEFMSFIEIEYK